MSNLPKDLSDLPRDLAEDVLSKVPVTSMRRVRSTCKKWNTLSRSRSFKKKHLGVQAKLATKKREFMMAMVIDFKVYLMSVNLHNNNEEGELLCMKRQGTLTSPAGSNQIYVRHVSHCDGLLLCVLKYDPRVLVFNPYCGKPRWILAADNSFRNLYSYALGYNSITKSYKILSVVMFNYVTPPLAEFRIYDLNSFDSSWRVLNFTRDWNIVSNRGVSLKGNTYWFAGI
ncbi:PREDICTED: putative F-box protein At3g23420 [Camelina sativa]|uniref:F-box protein At3g23420 n=1 Tax=Camelina sativa TaxID=90675 RepID=A0ABM1RD92_CAMSA|nr:PREDICTED: putative F-box protein At3g23420 [Camelina sativa]